MDKKLFYNNLAFRIGAPPLFGVMIYLMILMFFDSVNMLAENFFSREVMFVFGLTYLFFEVNRAVILILNKVFPLDRSIRLRIIFQYGLSAIATISLVSTVLFLYFRFVEGFTTIKTELITFNLIYLFTAAFYHLYFLSLVFLYKRNDRLVEGELQLKNHLQLELNAFRNQVNPEFLFQSLETIISALHESKKKADELIDNLAKTYRFTLDNSNNELISLRTEMQSFKAVRPIFEARFPGAIFIEQEIEKNMEMKNVVPNILTILFEKAVLSNLITTSIPLTFKIMTRGNSLIVGYNLNRKLQDQKLTNTRMEFLEKAYGYFGNQGMIHNQSNGFASYKIPLISIEEE